MDSCPLECAEFLLFVQIQATAEILNYYLVLHLKASNFLLVYILKHLHEKILLFLEELAK